MDDLLQQLLRPHEGGGGEERQGCPRQDDPDEALARHSPERWSTLFYGFYRGVSPDSDDGKMRKDAERAQEDLKKIKSLEDADGRKVFAMVGFVPLPQPGGEGPPEWDLSKLPADK